MIVVANSVERKEIEPKGFSECSIWANVLMGLAEIQTAASAALSKMMYLKQVDIAVRAELKELNKNDLKKGLNEGSVHLAKEEALFVMIVRNLKKIQSMAGVTNVIISIKGQLEKGKNKILNLRQKKEKKLMIGLKTILSLNIKLKCVGLLIFVLNKVFLLGSHAKFAGMKR